MNCDTILEQALLENGLIENPSHEKDMFRKKRFMDSIKKSPHYIFFHIMDISILLHWLRNDVHFLGRPLNAFGYAIADGSFQILQGHRLKDFDDLTLSVQFH